jgi:Tfp pilus assembly PilM family ATPase/Tfp pilus assembly protein PilN
MVQKVVTLYIDDTSIRALVTSGQRVKKWAEMPLETGLVKNSVVLKQEEVAAKIKQLFKVRKIDSKTVVLGISGLHCLTRPLLLPQLPKDMLEEAVKREAHRVLPVSLEQLYLQWQPIPAPEGKAQVFLVAIPRTAADALFNTLRLAGLKSDLVDLKPMLLARMVKDTMAIIVDVQPNEFDIVVMASGVPQPVRTVPFPDETASWQERISMIKEDVSRTIEFYNTNNSETPLASTLPVWASGQLANEADQCQMLSDELSRPVLPLPPPFESPDGLDSGRFMANMGLVLKKIAPVNSSGCSVSELNLLPEPYKPDPISLTRILTLPSTIIAVGLLLFLVLMIQNTSSGITETRNQLQTNNQLLQQRMAQNQEYTDAIAELQQQINDAKTSGGNFALALSTLEAESEGINSNLEATVNSLPEGVRLTSINQSGDTVGLNGLAQSEEDLLSYLRVLEDSEQFASITITSIGIAPGASKNFSVVLTVGE